MTTTQSILAASALVGAALIGSAVFAVSQGAFTERTVTAAPVAVECQPDAYLRQSDDLLREFLDHQVRAGSGNRSELAAAVADLQSTRRRFHAIEAPPCAVTFKAKMEAGMDATIDAALSMMTNPRADIGPLLARSTAEFKSAARQREELLAH